MTKISDETGYPKIYRLTPSRVAGELTPPGAYCYIVFDPGEVLLIDPPLREESLQDWQKQINSSKRYYWRSSIFRTEAELQAHPRYREVPHDVYQ